jgi:hypothetical protein
MALEVELSVHAQVFSAPDRQYNATLANPAFTSLQHAKNFNGGRFCSPIWSTPELPSMWDTTVMLHKH